MTTLGVVIGRFQPVHAQHVELIRRAQEQSDELLILVGSSNVAPCFRNPFTFTERHNFLSTAIIQNGLTSKNITIEPLADQLYNYENWLHVTANTILNYIRKNSKPISVKIKIFIVEKEKETSEYATRLKHQLDKFYSIFDEDNLGVFSDHVQVVKLPSIEGIHATDLRKDLFQILLPKDERTDYKVLYTPKIHNYACFADYESVLLSAIERKRNNFPLHKVRQSLNPRGEVELCADMFVCARPTHSWEEYHFIFPLIRRKDNNRLALPGGHMDPGETFLATGIRELREETGWNLTGTHPLDLEVETKYLTIFDSPHRSMGNRCITMGIATILHQPDWDTYEWLIYFQNNFKAQSDAGSIEIIQITKAEQIESLLNSDQFHDDHNQIIFKLLVDIIQNG